MSLTTATSIPTISPLPTANGHHRRLSTLGPGTSFGEMVLLGHRARSATAVADTDVACWVLSARRFDALVVTCAAHPHAGARQHRA